MEIYMHREIGKRGSLDMIRDIVMINEEGEEKELSKMELLMKEEGLQDTLNHLIHIGKPIEMDEEVFLEKLVHLKKEAYDETNDIRHLIKDIVPTYQPKS